MIKFRKININLKEILFIAGVVLAYRVLYVQFFLIFQNSNAVDSNFSFWNLIGITLGNTPITLAIAICNYWMVKFLNRKLEYGKNAIFRFSFELLYLIIFSAIITAIIYTADFYNQDFTDKGLVGLTFLSVLLVNTVIMYVITIFWYYRDLQQKALNSEILQKQKAQYQYVQLKRQLNPHFLFNSLNVLDQLIHTDADKASQFISKLAGVYRYLLSNEYKNTVTLAQELIFATNYIELMKERFTSGLTVLIDIPESFHDTLIVPCGLQTLLENAIKHNIASPESPLKVTVAVKDDYLTVSNPIQPKITRPESTKVGISNISKQYKTLFDRDIKIFNNDFVFEISLPIIYSDNRQ